MSKPKTMFKNYLLTAVRSLRRNSSYTGINFAGLTVGMVACLLLFLLVRYETSFDSFHSKKDRIFRVITINRSPAGDWRNGSVPFALTAVLGSSFPQLEAVAPTSMSWGQQIQLEQGKGLPPKVMEENVLFAGGSFFKIFDFTAIEGDPRVLLDAPYNAMLTKSTAQRFFGDWRSAVGKTMKMPGNVLVRVAGILADPPPNTDLPFKLVLSHSTLEAAHLLHRDLNDWGSINGNENLYVAVRPGASAAGVERGIDQVLRSHHPEHPKDGGGLQPLLAMHYDSTLEVYSGTTFSPELIRALIWIGVFLLVIACINFINLATAQAVNRAREVGVRKVLGSGRRQLVFRFLGETAVISGAALFCAVLLAIPLIKPVNGLLSTQLSSAPLREPGVIAFLLGVWAVVTGLAGLYPALVLSGFNPVTALKNKLAAGSARGMSLRRALVVVQFVIAQVLITGVLVIASQMNYFRQADLGFVKDAVIEVGVPRDSAGRAKMGELRQGLLANPGVEAFSYSFAAPTDNFGTWSDFRYDHRTEKTPFGASLRVADTNYFSLYHLRLAAGRMYRNSYSSDSNREYVINETCARKLGARNSQEVIGREINLWDGQQVGHIVGVVKDFFVGSLKDSMAPVMMMPWPALYGTANIKLQPARIKETLEAVSAAWKAAYPTYYFDYTFLDAKIAGLYRQEEQLSALYKVFAGIAIFISCLGLYGLISFLAVQRNKEIGIRKVLGASVGQVVGLLSKEFTLLVLVAFGVAAPVSWYFMHKWLENYVNRITLGPGYFVVTAVAAVGIAWLTVGYRAIRAGLANPAVALKVE